MVLKRGAFIVLEGCDRCGKTSQSYNIVKILKTQNVDAERHCFPDRSTTIGKVIDSYLKNEVNLNDQAIHLLFSANRWESVPKMKELLMKGITLITDRYSYSGVAYSFSKEESLDLDWYKNPERGLPKPDAVFYLDLKPEVIQQRQGFGGERYETTEFQKSVSKVYHELSDDTWKIIDADMSQEDLTNILVEEIKLVMDRVKHLPISTLWC